MTTKNIYLAALLILAPIKFASALPCDNCPDQEKQYQCLKCAKEECVSPVMLKNLQKLVLEARGIEKEKLREKVKTEQAKYDVCITGKCEATHSCPSSTDWTNI